jgi:hypothetical protein
MSASNPFSVFLFRNTKLRHLYSALSIEWITKRHEDNPEVAIAYWYFTFSDTTKQNMSEMYRSLIRQLLSCRPDTPEAVKTLADTKKLVKIQTQHDLRIL